MDITKLIPLEAFRWLILSAYLPRGDNAKLTRSELQEHVGHILEHHNLDEIFPGDFAVTPSNNSPGTRWKARFANIVGRLEKSNVLISAEDETDRKRLTIHPACRKEMVHAGLHIDRTNGRNFFTQLPDYVTATSWANNLPLTMDEELHPAIYMAEDGEERLEKISFLYNQRDFKGLLKNYTSVLERYRELIPAGNIGLTYQLWKEVEIEVWKAQSK